MVTARAHASAGTGYWALVAPERRELSSGDCARRVLVLPVG